MMPKSPTIAIPLGLSALLLAGITACNRSDSAPPHTDTTQTATPSPPSPAAPPAATASADAAAPEGKARREAMRQQIETVLTPDQANQLKTKLQQGEKMRQALTELNLTSEQNTKVQEIFKAAHAKHLKPAPAASPQ